jgi:glycosyltransferase involved in cell wall biosynthesis
VTDPARHDRDAGSDPGSPEAELAAARQERDAALRELAAFTQMSARQRARMEPGIEETARLVAERDRATRDLERIRNHPAVRAGLVVYQAVRSIRTLRRWVAARRRGADSAIADPDWRSTATSFRAAFLEAVEGTGVSGGRRLDLAVVLETGDPLLTDVDRSVAVGLARGLEGLGFRVAIVEVDDRTVPALTATPDVVVVVSAGVERGRLPLDVVSVAWVHDRVDRWLEDPRFDDHDLVMTTDDALASALEGRSAHPAQRVPGSAGDDARAVFVRDALTRWARAPKVAIHIGPLTWEAAASWGDTPFARAVQKEFGRRGWQASVHVHADRDSGTAQRADVALHVFGARAPSVHDGQVALLWVISHPDRVSGAMCDPYDVVFAASDLFARQLAERIGPPVVSLHQATDPDRFHPDPTGPEHALLFVGNSRQVRRRILADLVGTSHDVAVYGGGWTAELLHPHRLRGEWIHNWELRRYYSSAGIVLCDHYDDMRDEGFISNRAYDALACGAFVISDRVPAIEEEFDGGLVTYGDADELSALIDHYMSHPDERRARAESGRAAVLAHHTFAHRVDAIIGEITSRHSDLAQLAAPFDVDGALRR